MSGCAREIISRYKRELVQMRLLKSIDLHFAEFMCKLAGQEDNDALYLAALSACHSVMNNHTCCDLRQVAGRRIFSGVAGLPEEITAIVYPHLEDWVAEIKPFEVVGDPGEYCPLILDEDGRLYLQRYWEYEKFLAEKITEMSCDLVDVDVKVGSILEELFQGNSQDEIDWQKIAAFVALNKRFCVISGGPGTGKTTTVAKVLAGLQLMQSGRYLKIALAAPTGKAAARLQESIIKAKKSLNLSDELNEVIPEEASTLHRLLGYLPGKTYFKHNKDNPLDADVILVDEASMVSLPIYSSLFQALKPHSRLILLGDRNQLTSVESGAVLADLCVVKDNINAFSSKFSKNTLAAINVDLPKVKQSTLIDDSVVELQKSYRFGAIPGIGALASGVNTATDMFEASTLIELFGEYDEINYRHLPSNVQALRLAVEDVVKNSSLPDYMQAVESRDVEAAFDAFSKQMILCATRRGEFGVENMNSQVERCLKKAGYLSLLNESFYPGRPVMISENAYDMDLFNGDVGLTILDENGEVKVYFQTEKGYRAVSPSRLPSHDTVFAMTIHKSQGSEFDHPLIVLPAKISPLITKELVYTGITRAKKRVTMWFEESVFVSGVIQRVQRESGLSDRFLC